MKHIFFILCLFCSTALFAQHYSIPVKELDSTDLTAFKLKPSRVSVDIEQLADSMTAIICRVVTEYEEDITNTAYLSKRTVTESVVKLPLNDVVKSAFRKDGTYAEDKLNLILQAFKLKVKPEEEITNQ